ncbi:MAG TPA: hypothetical protein VM183_07315 [Burkholderiales bacterium]|nr:hypothetical protein [Burkholderiales bacterium]
MKILKAFAVAGIFALPGAWAMAAPDDAGTPARFDSLDRNADGFVSRDEAKDAEELHTRFSELDANNDGKLTREEYGVLARESRTRRDDASAGSSRAAPGKRSDNSK